MNKIMLVLSFILAACSSSQQPARPEQQAPAVVSPTLIGGWAPVFLVSFDRVQLDSIAQGLKEQRIKRAVISYPTKMQNLAEQIHVYLESASAQKIPLKSIELKDTSQVKYNLTQVIVTLYFN